jgi:ribosomal protein S20
VESMLKKHTPRISTAVVGADSKLAHLAEVGVFETERAARYASSMEVISCPTISESSVRLGLMTSGPAGRA